jgi:hypothetical protein
MDLNCEQRRAFQKIIGMKFKSPFGIRGEAGTGKTHIFQYMPKKIRVAYTAPTNKAVGALIDSGCPAEHCMTIHKFLGLKLSEDDGQTSLDSLFFCLI